MEKLVNARSIYDAIDEIEMSDRQKAAAKARMRDAEVIAECIVRVVDGVSRLGRAAMAKRVSSGNVQVAPRAN